jgi:fluoroacetyl-CoA thioesterase
MRELVPGLKGTITRTVTDEMSADRLGNPGARVLATPILGLFFEHAATELLAQALGAGTKSLGVRLEVLHLAPTPVGMDVTVEATLEEVHGRRLRFELEARDSIESIGSGSHERVLVDWDRFLDSVKEKGKRA